MASLAFRVAKSRAWLAQSAFCQGRHMLLPCLNTSQTGHTWIDEITGLEQ